MTVGTEQTLDKPEGMYQLNINPDQLLINGSNFH